MTCRIYCKILLALVICITVGIDGNSAYHIPRHENRAGRYNTETGNRDASQDEYSFDGETNFRTARRDFWPVFRSAHAGGCRAHDIDANYPPSPGDCFAINRDGHACLSARLPGCMKIQLFWGSACREGHLNAQHNVPFQLGGSVGSEGFKSFKVDYSGCPEDLQDITGPVNQQTRVESPETPDPEHSLNIPNEYPQDSQSPSRWFQVKLQEFQRKGNRLTKL